MASAWQTLEEAALTLGISSRTLHRRIARNEVQTRLQNGRREVLVEIPDPEPSPYVEAVMADVAPDVMDGEATTSSPSSATSDDVRHTMLALQEDRLRRTDLAIVAYQQSMNVAAAEARRSRITARVAWCILGSSAVAMFLAVVWFTHNLTEARGQVGHLTDELQAVSVKADTLAQQTDALRQQAQDAKLAAARAEGELVATKRELEERRQVEAQQAQVQVTPTTQPVILFDRLADIFAAN